MGLTYLTRQVRCPVRNIYPRSRKHSCVIYCLVSRTTKTHHFILCILLQTFPPAIISLHQLCYANSLWNYKSYRPNKDCLRPVPVCPLNTVFREHSSVNMHVVSRCGKWGRHGNVHQATLKGLQSIPSSAMWSHTWLPQLVTAS